MKNEIKIMNDENRLGIVQVSEELIDELRTSEYFKDFEEIDTSRYYNNTYDPQVLYVLYKSEYFRELKKGEKIPQYNITVHFKSMNLEPIIEVTEFVKII